MCGTGLFPVLLRNAILQIHLFLHLESLNQPLNHKDFEIHCRLNEAYILYTSYAHRIMNNEMLIIFNRITSSLLAESKITWIVFQLDLLPGI
jgi:hypothetical protein